MISKVFITNAFLYLGIVTADSVCTWNSKAGAHFDLRPLQITKSTDLSYSIEDGDIPCTPETEPSYDYVWNFCDTVSDISMPSYCTSMGKTGVVLQHIQYTDTMYYCYILGHFDPKKDEITYRLLDEHDPSKGVSVQYPAGEMCSSSNPYARSATIRVECANVPAVVSSAQEPSICSYELSMKSYYGCPTECGITKNGLCDSHGHCAYDPVKKTPYCYCNTGYYGSSCNSKTPSDESYDGYSVQIGLLVGLLLLAVGLVAGVVYMGYQITEFRKEQTSTHYKALAGGESEMVETVSFR